MKSQKSLSEAEMGLLDSQAQQVKKPSEEPVESKQVAINQQMTETYGAIDHFCRISRRPGLPRLWSSPVSSSESNLTT
jgi:hypothetical protein